MLLYLKKKTNLCYSLVFFYIHQPLDWKKMYSSFFMTADG